MNFEKYLIANGMTSVLRMGNSGRISQVMKSVWESKWAIKILASAALADCGFMKILTEETFLGGWGRAQTCAEIGFRGKKWGAIEHCPG